MASSHPTIPPFPADIDRDYFGAWLSGFTDGEGCFLLRANHTRVCGYIQFRIQLRHDDVAILRRIQSYWQCGHISYYDNSRDRTNKRPSSELNVTRLSEQIDTVAAHFDRYPLMAKKARDFVVWRKALEFCWEVHRRRRPKRRGKGCRGGMLPTWTPDDIMRFHGFVDELKEIRRYEHAGIQPIIARSPKQSCEQRTMW